jgi:arsenite/tail-anchored protein-transporting ATPase
VSSPLRLSTLQESMQQFRDHLDRLGQRRLVLFGGKGGVGKTTVASLAALHWSSRHPVTLFSTDPASNLGDLFAGVAEPHLRVESIRSEALHARFLEANLEQFIELGDRGTWLDRDELRRLFELAIPGIDELMGWLEIGRIFRQRSRSMLVVDTAPTGHTLRLLHSSIHYERLVSALDSMQEKHREMVEQMTRRTLRDALDDYLTGLRQEIDQTSALLHDRETTAFVTVLLPEPLVVVQSERLIETLTSEEIPAPLVIANRVPLTCDCSRCRTARRNAKTLLAPFPSLALLPEACTTLDSAMRLRQMLSGAIDELPSEPAVVRDEPLDLPPSVNLIFTAGKGGVGKTTTAGAIALKLLAGHPAARAMILSIDPAHGLTDLFGAGRQEERLTIETIDTRARWEKLSRTLGEEIGEAISSLTPGLQMTHDSRIVQQLLDTSPPGADEIFALTRIADLMESSEYDFVIVDTAPTGHFLRLLDLPQTAGAWVRELMRLLLNYRELIPPASLGERLLEASRSLRSFELLIRSDRCGVVLVTRAEPIVVAETLRLQQALREKGLSVLGTVVNYVSPETACRCDQIRRAHELGTAASLGRVTIVERQPAPPELAADLRDLIPMRQTR